MLISCPERDTKKKKTTKKKQTRKSSCVKMQEAYHPHHILFLTCLIWGEGGEWGCGQGWERRCSDSGWGWGQGIEGLRHWGWGSGYPSLFWSWLVDRVGEEHGRGYHVLVLVREGEARLEVERGYPVPVLVLDRGWG